MRPQAPIAAPVTLAATASGSSGFDMTAPAVQSLAERAVRPLAERLHRGGTVRVWVPHCGNGTAAFGVAMLFAAAMERLGCAAMPRIFATERHPEVIRAASTGRMQREAARSFLKAGHRRRLTWTGDGWQVKSAVRGRILFSVHDTLNDTAFADVDLIVADAAVDRSPGGCAGCVMGQLVTALAKDGLLFLGPDRFLGVAIGGLDAVDAEAGLYRRRGGLNRRTREVQTGPPRGAVLLERLAHHFAPSALVVDAGGRITATIGEPAALLRRAPGQGSGALGTATDPALRPAMVGALVEAVRTEVATVRPVGDGRDLWVQVEPIANSELDEEPLWLLRVRSGCPTDQGTADDASELRAHLERTARTLQHTMDEVAAHNIALATANDELQAINEELKTSNQRLAAVNTELIAVRQDHERQIDELSGLSHDVDNLLRAADIALVVLDAAHRIRRYTPAAASLFRLSKTDVGHGFGQFLHDHEGRVMAAVKQVTKEGGSARMRLDWSVEGGEPRAFQVQIHPYTKGEDEVAGAVVGFTDMSEATAAQDGLQRQNQALQRANEDLERFAYIASHDLKSPLRSVRTMLEFLKADLGDVLKGDNAEHLDLVAQRVQQMERMIEDLLAYSRLGREAGPVETVDVAALVKSQIEMLAPPEGFTVEFETELPTLRAEAGLLEHVLRNLIENAIKHHDRPEGRVVVRCFEQASTAVFEVSDDGPGIAERYQQRVFEIFQKGGGRTNTTGSGMGLALVKKAVEGQGGTIDLISKDGERGTTFRFTWPTKAQEDPAGEPSA